MVPAIYEFITLRADAEMFEGLPVITLQGSPLYGWNVVLNNAFPRLLGKVVRHFDVDVMGRNRLFACPASFDDGGDFL